MMGGEKQLQRAGNNSQQFQANVINMGIDEKRAREICKEMYEVARNDLAKEAYECAQERVSKFEDKLMPKMLKVDEALTAFADPSFQILLTSAQKTAACTEREIDYDILSELLVSRIQRGKSRKTNAGINRAAEVVDEIDDDALCALTVAYAVMQLSPTLPSCSEGLQTLSNVFSSLIYLDLPNNYNWMEHLELLDAIKITPFSQLRKIDEFYCESLNGYVCTGIEKHSEEYEQAIEILNSIGIKGPFLIENELCKGFVRLPIVNRNNYSNLCLNTMIAPGKIISRQLGDREKKAFDDILGLYKQDEELTITVKTEFMQLWNQYESLKKIKEWWDNIPSAFSITHVGIMLANANARRCDEGIPETPLPWDKRD